MLLRQTPLTSLILIGVSEMRINLSLVVKQTKSKYANYQSNAALSHSEETNETAIQFWNIDQPRQSIGTLPPSVAPYCRAKYTVRLSPHLNFRPRFPADSQSSSVAFLFSLLVTV